MTITRIPHIVILKPVHVHLQTAIIIDIRVGNEDIVRCAIYTTTDQVMNLLYLIWDVKVLQHIAPTGCFLKKSCALFCKTYPTKLSHIIFHNPNFGTVVTK